MGKKITDKVWYDEKITKIDDVLKEDSYTYEHFSHYRSLKLGYIMRSIPRGSRIVHGVEYDEMRNASSILKDVK